jgi:ubiquinone/menaquinone biosynthesis C-methylase UbiE
MAIGKLITEKGGHIAGFQQELNVLSKDKEKFLTFFNSCDNAFEAQVRGAWDFSVHVAAPLSGYIKNPHLMTCLEVGYGGGRILATAAKNFKHAIGVDIHEHNKLVASELESNGIKNIDLYKTDGSKFPLENNTIDLAYSFIVFQHMELMKIFINNLAEVYRVLKPDGIAIIYYGRTSRLSLNRKSILLAKLDSILEFLPFNSKYKEIEAHVNCTNLLVSKRYASQIARSIGFEILTSGKSRRNVPDGGNFYGGQNYFILKKN